MDEFEYLGIINVQLGKLARGNAISIKTIHCIYAITIVVARAQVITKKKEKFDCNSRGVMYLVVGAFDQL